MPHYNEMTCVLLGVIFKLKSSRLEFATPREKPLRLKFSSESHLRKRSKKGVTDQPVVESARILGVGTISKVVIEKFPPVDRGVGSPPPYLLADSFQQ
jgi:hypothetical protein